MAGIRSVDAKDAKKGKDEGGGMKGEGTARGGS
jgi:hypothetical protein